MGSIQKIALPRPFTLVLLGLIIILSLYFRTRKIAQSPGWFRDEGTYLEIARRIGKKPLPLGAVNVTFVGPNMTHPPLYFLLSHLSFKFGQPDMRTFRLFNASLGVLATLLIFLLGYEVGRPDEPSATPTLHQEMLGLIAAFFYTIHPDAVMYNRMGMPYNLYLIEAILVALFALRYIRTGEFVWCLAASIVASAALLTVYYSVVFIVFLFIVILARKKPRHLWSLACIPVPLIIFLIFMAAGKSPGFWDDITALRSASRAGSLYLILLHYEEFFQSGISYVLGILGLFFFRRKAARIFLPLLCILMAHIVLRRADTIIKFVHYPVIPLLPFIALGCAAIALRISEAAKSVWGFIILLLPFLLATYVSIGQVRYGIYGRFNTPLEFGMTKNTLDTYKVAEYVNAHTEPDDLVLATTTLWSLLHTRTADLAQALAYEGKKVDFYRHNFPRERFLFSPAISQATYIVMDSFTDQWRKSPPASFNAPFAEAIKEVEEKWHLVHQQGEYHIYENPKYLERTRLKSPEQYTRRHK